MYILVLCLLAGIVFSDHPSGAADRNYTTAAYHREVGLYKLAVEYPRFKAGKLPASAVKRVNNEIKRFILRKADPLHPDYDDDGSESSDGVSFEVIRADAHYVSIKFEDYYYMSGAAHGLMRIFVFNYDVRAKKMVQLGDLFKKGAAYEENISRICIADILKEQGSGVENWIKAGASADEDNFSAFAVSDKALTIYFQPYQVTSYAGGYPEVKIPFSKLPGLRKDI